MTKNNINNGYKGLISKPEVSFWVPIILTIVSWAFFAGITITKVDQVIKNQEQQYTMWLQLEKRVGNTELNINSLLTIHPEVKSK